MAYYPRQTPAPKKAKASHSSGVLPGWSAATSRMEVDVTTSITSNMADSDLGSATVSQVPEDGLLEDSGNIYFDADSDDNLDMHFNELIGVMQDEEWHADRTIAQVCTLIGSEQHIA